MRMMVSWQADVEASNKTIQNGTLTQIIEGMIEKLKPEASYFFANEGYRGGMFVFDMTDSSQIPMVAEPLFQQHNAKVEIKPVMNMDDLKKALANI
jgi:Domain of unknown function (DUF3303)